MLGLQIAPERSILAPTAHNEPAIHLEHLQGDVPAADGDRLQHEVEKAFLKSTFDIRAVAEETVGCGVDLLDGRRALSAQPRRKAFPKGRFCCTAAASTPARAATELLDFFGAYKDEGGPATLVLMGAKLMPLPECPGCGMPGCCPRPTAFAHSRPRRSSSCRRRSRACRCWRSKGWRSAIPVLCNARADVLVDHCRRSNAGLFYANRDEFAECVHLLLADRRLRERMGRNGKAYVDSQLLVGRHHGEVRQADGGASRRP